MDRGAHYARETTRALATPHEIPEFFTADVVTVAYPHATIRPFKATTAGTQLIGMIAGNTPAVGDRVLCCWVSGEPFIVGVIAASASTELRLAGGARIYSGSGSPAGVISAPLGSIYLRTGGSRGTTIYTKTSNTGTVGWIALAAQGSNIIAPPGLSLDPVANSVFLSNTTYAIYMGRADDEIAGASVRLEVKTAAATITWAEVAIATSPDFVVPGSTSLTTRGFTNVAASFNTTGEKTVLIGLSGIAPGDNLWLMVGSQATTPFQLQAAIGGLLSASQIQTKSTTRPSTMAAASAFTSAFNSAGFYGIMSAS